MAASNAVFAVVNAAFLRPLPYPDAHALVAIREMRTADPADRGGISYLNFEDLRRSSQSFASMALASPTSATFVADGLPRRVEGLLVSSGFFETIGMPPASGRMLTAADEGGFTSGSRASIVLTDSGWRTLFGGRSDVVGQTARLDGQLVEVVGVMPRGFFPIEEEPAAFFASNAALGAPSDPKSANGSRNYRGYPGAVGRLGPGVSIQAAREELTSIYGVLSGRQPAVFTGRRVQVDALREVFVGSARRTLGLIAGLVAVVVLVAAVNVSNLLVARAASRQREVVIRAALGAGTSGIVRVFVMEGVVIAMLGGLAGWWLSGMMLGALAARLPAGVPQLVADADWRVMAFTALAALTVGLISGIAPAYVAARSAGRRDYVTTERQSTGAMPKRLRRALLGGQVGLAAVLLVAAGLLLNSLIRLHLVLPGYDVDRTLAVPLRLEGRSRFDGPPTRPIALNQYLSELRASIEAIPGVDAVAFAQSVPLTGVENSTRFTVVGRSTSTDAPSAQLRFVSDGYIETLGIPVRAGRTFTRDDGPSASPVMVVNEAFVREHFPTEDPIGRLVRAGWGGEAPKTIVGVVGDVRHRAMSDAPRAEMYVPQAQFANRQVTLVVRAGSSTDAVAAPIVAALRAFDPDAPVTAPRSLASYRAATLALPSFGATIVGGFGGMALLLTLVGVYGVTSYSVAQRTREIGVRMALGGRVGDIRRLVVREGLAPVWTGLALGLLASAVVARGLQAWIFDVAPTDPLTYAVVAALLGGVALAACLVPAAHAARLDPLVALRDE